MFNIPDLSTLLSQHLHDDVQQLALQRNRFPHLSDADFRFFLQQIEGRQRTRDKLPTLAQKADWWYPVRLSCEQCSSEATACYKTQIIQSFYSQPSTFDTFIDLTGGYGIDTFFMAQHAEQAHYVERNAELCAIAEHNFSLYRPHILIHNTTAEAFLASLPHHPLAQRPIGGTPSNTLIYLDPARRSLSGGKVFRIEDCEPNVIDLLPSLRKHASHIMIKFSPMLDITAALRALGKDWDTHIVAVHNEVKEVLLTTGTNTIHAVNICATHTDRFVLSHEDEKNAPMQIASHIEQYIYEPNAAIIKAGAFRLVGERYGLQKLDTNTHLYTSSTLLPQFPGRKWHVQEVLTKHSTLHPTLKYSILTRNYPLSPDQLRKKLKLQDGDDLYIIGARLQGKPVLILGNRV